VKISLLLRENLINCPCKLFHALDSGTFKIFRPGITRAEKAGTQKSFVCVFRVNAFTGYILAERLLERFKIQIFDVECF